MFVTSNAFCTTALSGKWHASALAGVTELVERACDEALRTGCTAGDCALAFKDDDRGGDCGLCIDGDTCTESGDGETLVGGGRRASAEEACGGLISDGVPTCNSSWNCSCAFKKSAKFAGCNEGFARLSLATSPSFKFARDL
jgi:hypothetical protein